MSNEGDQSLATRRTSFSITEETDSAGMAAEKEPVNAELNLRKKSIVLTEVVPESAILDTPPIESSKKTGYMNGNGLKATTPAVEANGSVDKKNTPVVAADAAESFVREHQSQHCKQNRHLKQLQQSRPPNLPQ